MAFEYTPYRNPYIGTIADLMARGEDAKAKALIDVASAQARAAEAKGQIYGNAISSIGNQIGNIPAQMQANREQAFKADQQARMVRGQQREDAAEDTFNQIMSQKNVLGGMFGPMSAPVVTPGVAGTDMEPDTPETQTLPSRAFIPTVTNPFKELSIKGVDGLDKWDIEKASQQFASQGLGVQGQKYLELMRGSNDDMDKHHASAMSLVQKSAARALQAGSFDMMLGSTNALMDQLANNKVIGREDLAVFQQQLDGLNALPQDQKETALQGLLRNISGTPNQEQVMGPGEGLYVNGRLLVERPIPIQKPAADTSSIQEYKFAVSQGYTGSFEQWSIDDAKRRRPSGADQSETIGLRNDLIRQDIRKNDLEFADIQTKKDLNKLAAEQAAQGTVDTVSNLLTIDPRTGNVTGLAPGTSNLFGARIPFLSSIGGTKTANVDAYLKELTSERLVELIGEMKSQSRTGATGFGSLTAPELTVLQQASTVLNQRNISDATALKELTKIYNIARKYNQPPFDNKEPGSGITAVPDLKGLTPGKGALIQGGPFDGQTWSIDKQGNPYKVSG